MLPVPIFAQTQLATVVTPAKPLVTRAIDDTKLITMKGSVHPLTRTGIDRGVVSDSFAAGRLILLLNRPPERKAALQQFLQATHTPGSASYHQWLTPEQFGSHFGPADADIQSVTGWLNSHGFNATKISKSIQYIEFPGTAGQLREAFHTEIHQYEIHDETQYANASEIGISKALAPLVGGVSPLNSFHAKSDLRVVGLARYS
jgi:subtilase family serine protease